MPGNRKELLGISVLLLPLLSVAILVGWRPLDAWAAAELSTQNQDPYNIVKYSLEAAEAGHPFVFVDPPFRYVPLGIVYALLQPSQLLAEKIAHTWAAILAFVGIPATVYWLFREAVDYRVGLLTIAGFIVWRLFGIGLTSYINGAWQYLFTLPLIFLALWAAHRGLTAGDSRQWFILTGVLVGLVGLTQYVYGLYTSIIIGAILLWHRQVRPFAVVGAIGASMASLLLLLPSTANSYVPAAAVTRINGSHPWTLSLLVGGVRDLFTTPSYLFVFMLLLACAVLYRITRQRPTETGVVEIATLILASLWLTAVILVNPNWYRYLAQAVLQYLLLGILCQQILALWDVRFSAVELERLEMTSRRVALAWVSATGVLFIVSVLLIPTHLP